ncbi:Imm52 family immunity protein [Paraburkholderia bryophila]|uniref:Uncharacterized protein n=1 Tax=Paraburkholderia bryophila TaxID=420952 RepID=A0A7Z0B2U0_9BURK|nr:Imm52 family immunity protein [Paraburkholderia bryophila]NYH17885.1 hypothetical protein [Paraburkholderia bryophila]
MQTLVSEEHSLNIELTYRLAEPQLPAIEDAYGRLWRFASVLTRAGLPIEKWHPVTSNKKATLRNIAFDANGPTSAAIAVANRSRRAGRHIARSLSVWNGIYEDGGAILCDAHVINRQLCCLDLKVFDIAAFQHFATVVDLVSEAARIWSASSVQVGPSGYFFDHKAFEKRPGVGWMLYLPRVLTAPPLPEAPALIPVIDGEHQRHHHRQRRR